LEKNVVVHICLFRFLVFFIVIKYPNHPLFPFFCRFFLESKNLKKG